MAAPEFTTATEAPAVGFPAERPVRQPSLATSCVRTADSLRRVGLAVAVLAASQGEAIASMDGFALAADRLAPEPAQYGPQRKGTRGKPRRW